MRHNPDTWEDNPTKLIRKVSHSLEEFELLENLKNGNPKSKLNKIQKRIYGQREIIKQIINQGEYFK